MISIRDADKQKLEEVEDILFIYPNLVDSYRAHRLILEVLQSIEELSQMAPVIDPLIVPMSEEDKRICYPERYR
jgi:hypothetical protein